MASAEGSHEPKKVTAFFELKTTSIQLDFFSPTPCVVAHCHSRFSFSSLVVCILKNSKVVFIDLKSSWIIRSSKTVFNNNIQICHKNLDDG
jgi:hypothetical protein